jgi:hypothetical protein
MKNSDIPCINGGTREKAPEWALLEWELIKQMEQAVEVFLEKYVRDDGTLIWREFWPGMDGADDAFESFQNYPLLYSLGAGKRLLELAHREWDATAWQWTEYGQLHREFWAYYDWMHHGEGNLFFYYMGLADPLSFKFRMRAARFASFYMGEDPNADNFDMKHKLMRAPINGSLGPRFAYSPEDWETHRAVLDNYLPPFEDMPGIPFVMGKCDWTGEETFETILEFLNKRMAKGDVPLNLGATSLLAHAYLYTGEDKYKNWVTDYLEAWEKRTKANGGIIPDNIGPSGKIGECMDGKWWGGYYGWRWPHGALTVIEPLIIAGCNALMLTGENRWLDLARSQLDMLYEKRKLDDSGEPIVPMRHFVGGWTDYRREDSKWPVYIWSVTMDESDKARIGRLAGQDSWGEIPRNLGKGNRMDIAPWYRYITKRSADFPAETLKANCDAVERRLAEISGDNADVKNEDIHHWQDKNPVICEALVQLMLGGSTNIYHGGLMYTALRYFSGGRPGLPEHVGALVETIDKEGVSVRFHNGSRMPCEFTIQGGCFGEHTLTKAKVSGSGEIVPIDGKYLNVRLGSNEGIKLRISMNRFTQKPGYLMPGQNPGDLPMPIKPRQIVF